MMFRCLECGNLFEEGEEKRWVEPYGEEMKGCPLCFGAYEEAEACELCGEYAEELFGGVCQDCIDCYKNDVETCYKIGGTYKDEVKINGFLATMFTEKDIENILLENLKNSKKVDCTSFIENDKEYFGEQLVEVENEK